MGRGGTPSTPGLGEVPHPVLDRGGGGGTPASTGRGGQTPVKTVLRARAVINSNDIFCGTLSFLKQNHDVLDSGTYLPLIVLKAGQKIPTQVSNTRKPLNMNN